MSYLLKLPLGTSSNSVKTKFADLPSGVTYARTCLPLPAGRILTAREFEDAETPPKAAEWAKIFVPERDTAK